MFKLRVVNQRDISRREGRCETEQPALDRLLAEANALLIQARKRAAPPQAESARLSAARAILGILGRRGPQTVPELARERLTSRQNTQVIVNRLLAEGLAQIRANPAHRRSSLVWLTEKGSALLEQAARDLNAASAPVEAISEEEIRRATALLQRLRESWGKQE